MMARRASGLGRAIARDDTSIKFSSTSDRKDKDTVSRRAPMRAAITCCGGGGLITRPRSPVRGRDRRSNSAASRSRTGNAVSSNRRSSSRLSRVVIARSSRKPTGGALSARPRNVCDGSLQS